MSGRASFSGKVAPDLVVIEQCHGHAEKLLQLQGALNPPPVLVLSSAVFKKNPEQWVTAVAALLVNPPGIHRSTQQQSRKTTTKDIFLEDFVERKLKDFVKKIHASRSSNLYALLLKEIEKPLINLTLKETKGNQVKAAAILGLNRNTLRKKIKELKISIK